MSEIIRALTGREMSKLLPKTPVVTYNELKTMSNLDNLLRQSGQFIVLYMEESDYGHWVCVFIHNNQINFFDSYGLAPDSLQLKGVDPKVIRDQNEDRPYLTNLLTGSGYPVNWNRYRVQGRNVSTCGRHCVVRLYLKSLNDDQYHQFLKSFEVDPDIIVTIITENIFQGFPTSIKDLKELLRKK